MPGKQVRVDAELFEQCDDLANPMKESCETLERAATGRSVFQAQPGPFFPRCK